MKSRVVLISVLMVLILTACGEVEMVPAPMTPRPEITRQAPKTRPSEIISAVETIVPNPDDVAATLPVQAGRGEETDMNTAPQPGDTKFTRGKAFVEESSLVIRESMPPQVSMRLVGNLPTPCHKLRVQVDEPDANGRIVLTIYSVFKEDMMCAQVLKPFDVSVPLNDYPAGSYTVLIDRTKVGEFSIP